jgi:hypothetical protein
VTRPNPLGPSAESRLAEAMKHYLTATEDVERALAEEPGVDDPFVFALARRSLDEIAVVSKRLARAELQRRSTRAALHALIELIALDPTRAGVGPVPNSDYTEGDEHVERARWRRSLKPGNADHAWMRHTDRLIALLEFANAAGCTYTNDTFTPIVIRDRPKRPKSKGDDTESD